MQQGAASVAESFEHVPAAEGTDGKRATEGDEAGKVGTQRGVDGRPAGCFAQGLNPHVERGFRRHGGDGGVHGV